MSQRLSSLNLNLLLALDALLDEENVTTAAKRLHVTQPTVSRQLAALRDWFDDPLLVRGRQGLQKTPRAKALALPLRQALAALESAVGAGLDFRPEHTERSFRIAAPDFVSAVVGKPLLQTLQSTAPHATLVFRPLHLDRVDAQLDDGEVDFVVGPKLQLGPNVRRQRMHTDSWSVACRACHPLLDVPFDVERYAAFPHILVSPAGVGRSRVDDVLEERGLQRRIVARLASFLAAPHLLSSSDALLTAPSSVLRLLADATQLVVQPLPLEVAPLEVFGLWHGRDHNDSAHHWMRSLLRSAFQQLQHEAPLDSA